jgi:FkbM family methyltransferase
MEDNGEKFAIKEFYTESKIQLFLMLGLEGVGCVGELLQVTNYRAEVYAFEPSKCDYEKLVNDLVGRAHVFNLALGASEGELKLFSPKDTRGLNSFHRGGLGFTEIETAKITTIDQFYESKQIKSIHLLKLDVEGHVLACLQGAQAMLPHIKNIQFEMSVVSRDAQVYLRDLFELLSDYRIHRILKDGFWEIKSPDKFSKLLFTTNYLATRKN